MFGIAVPIAGEVRLIPLRNKYWKISLHNNGHEKEKQQRCIMFQKYEEPNHKKESKKLLRIIREGVCGKKIAGVKKTPLTLEPLRQRIINIINWINLKIMGLLYDLTSCLSSP